MGNAAVHFPERCHLCTTRGLVQILTFVNGEVQVDIRRYLGAALGQI